MKTMTKPNSINLGLAISGALLKPGERRTQRELAAFCDCSYQRIQQIEERALRKVRIFVTRELNSDSKEVLLDGMRLLSQTKVNLWDQQTRRMQ